MNTISSGFYNFSLWISRLAYVNLLWIVFSLLGLGVLGLMPATAGMFAVIRKWVLGRDDIPIFSTFWGTFKKEFLKINLIGYILILIGYVLYMEVRILWVQESAVYILAGFGVLALIFIYSIVLLYIFPIFAHFKLNTFQYIKWPAIIGIVHPILTIVLGGGLLFLHYLTYVTIPALLFFFGGSVTAYVLTWGISKTFNKYEQTAS
ncbi:YesL family protein [Virgibacillus halodenitrificans]|uniref:YesL family protein n=1 Tax=Virgibacillus halodenitrificans TaxID=1482 RepID=UPI0002D82A2F|nr:DUF624 domain-containing protein [Virgibacillus halodenitrificans]MYL46718.1 DUF624 domain-containing protein [Virgibacillus halodenitrificans]MYL57973.1 DUF624 domain-containing protein [Virgibacillus halodenitrificans]